ALHDKNLAQHFNIVISTDHGFITNVGKTGLTEFLISQGLKKDKDSDDVVVAEGALYVKNHDETIIRKIVSALQDQEWVGAIFTKSQKAGDLKGKIEGTLSFESIHWNHPERSADILVDENWDDRKNEMGYAGASFSRGVAGHGGLSPYEVNIALIAGGPSFKARYQSDWPTSNVDLVPTILKIHNITIPPGMDGRIIHELLVKGEQETKVKPKKEIIKTTSAAKTTKYELSLERTILGKYVYVDFAKVIRTVK
ncbi:MAG: alkaline phosphatase family protein, partial [Marivirga sp.]|nr:alkaline phosphatase family protein [Marivirga sp.]